MKATFAAAVLLAAAATAPAAVDAYMTFITLPQDVKLGDGSVLPAGKYDVRIDYKGFGNAAGLTFSQKGVPRGKAPAEARGFPSQAPPAVVGPADKKLQKEHSAAASDTYAKLGDIKGESLDDKHKDTLEKQKVPVPGGPQEFNWSRAGFPPGAAGKAAPAGRGFLKLSFDSANSAAGFSALLPVVEKTRK